ncbi:quinate transport protein [Stemphylium lycopersici]|nr:hypothetical protein TW65_00667 [Stemphylium lycopersici]RAR01889.1 quinate transport protein [Stemphylium lycopersici]
MCRIKGDRVDYCERAHSGQTCEVKRSSRTYSHTRGSGSRDDTPSPVHPLTPNGSGTYLTQHRRPSNSGSRPSTRDGLRVTNDLIIVSGSKKGRSGKYQHVTFSTKGNKRSSLGSLGSNEAAIDSAGSDASYTLRTGFPEAPLPPPNAYDHPNTYLPTPSVSHGYHNHHTWSPSSSQTPSLTVTAEADHDLPAGRRGARPPAPIIHNPILVPPSSTRPQVETSSGPYRTSRVVPSGVSQGAYTPTGTSPLDYDQYADFSGSSRTNSGAAEPSRPAKNSSERRKKPSGDRNYQEDFDRKVAQALEKDENDKQVRFELGRAKARAEERAERALAEKEKERAAEREARHQRKAAERLENEKRELEEQKVKDRKKEKSKPLMTDYSKRPTSSRKYSSSMTQEQQAEQWRLLEADRLAMQSEKQAAEEREREEARAAARQQQETSSYYDPRGGDRTLSNANNPTMPRRGSLSRHDSVASTRPPLTRSSSKRRSSVSQPSSPIINTQPAEYSARPPSSRTHAPPPLSFPKSFNPGYSRPQPARRPSFGQESNPLSPSFSTSSGRDQWDMRAMESALPSTRPSGESRYYTTQSREPVISYSARPVRRPTDYVSTFDDDDDVSDYVDPPVYVSRPGISRSGSRRKQ